MAGLKANVSFIGAFPAFSPAENEAGTDFRDVPASDDGGYNDRGALGSYAPTEEPFRYPADVRFETGYGASQADLNRGYCAIERSGDPAYSEDGYQNRWTLPEQTERRNADFPYRNERSKGFLPRPRIPTER